MRAREVEGGRGGACVWCTREYERDSTRERGKEGVCGIHTWYLSYKPAISALSCPFHTCSNAGTSATLSASCIL
jgi:hypothetical protein